MRGVVFRIFLFDGASKIFLAASSLMLIKYLQVDEYSVFIAIFTYSMIVYQGVCGVIERLYIAEHEKYVPYQNSVKYLLVLTICGGFCFYVFFYQGILSGAVFLLLVLVSVNYQIERIKLQKHEKFDKFILVEFFRNLSWFVLAIITVWLVKDGAGYVVLISYALATGVMLFFMKESYQEIYTLNYNYEIKNNIIYAVGYLGGKKNIILYSIMAAVFPYLAFIIISILGDEILIATYGAALRYQAIFSVVVYSANVVLVSKMANNVGNEHQILFDFKKTLPWLLLTAWLASVVVWWMIPVINDGKYPDTQSCFVIMIFCSLCSLLAAPFVNILLANHLYTKMLCSLLAGLVVFMVLLPLLYTKSRDFGVLYALALSYFVVLCCNVFFANNCLSNENIDR